MKHAGPIREIKDIREVTSAKDMRAIQKDDFLDALTQVRASVGPKVSDLVRMERFCCVYADGDGIKDLEGYMKFEQEYGSITRR